MFFPSGSVVLVLMCKDLICFWLVLVYGVGFPAFQYWLLKRLSFPHWPVTADASAMLLVVAHAFRGPRATPCHPFSCSLECVHDGWGCSCHFVPWHGFGNGRQ